MENSILFFLIFFEPFPKYNLIDSTVAGESDTDASIDPEAARLTKGDGDPKSEHYSDYYEHVAHSSHIRPIAVTEDVNFNTMSSSQRLCWWMSTTIQTLR